MWHPDDPGFSPSPDPAAEAERYYAERSRYDDDPDERYDEDCPGYLVMVYTPTGVHHTEPCICSPKWPSWRWPRTEDDGEDVPF